MIRRILVVLLLIDAVVIPASFTVPHWAGWYVWWQYPECRNAPKVVPFHTGMTLCPGQAATFEIIIPLPAREDNSL